MTLRNDIRKETDRFHKLAEAATDKYAPLQTKQGYHTFLSGMFKVYSVFGTAADSASLLIGIEPRSSKIMRALKKDLGEGFQIDSSKPQKLAQYSKNQENYLGIAYALEGSALGSKIILQTMVESNIKGVSLNYLSLLANQSSSRWPMTLKALNALETGHQIAINSAQSVFELVAKAMEAANDSHR